MNTIPYKTLLIIIVILVVIFLLIPAIYAWYKAKKCKHTYRYKYIIRGDKKTNNRHLWRCSRCGRYALSKWQYPLDTKDFDQL